METTDVEEFLKSSYTLDVVTIESQEQSASNLDHPYALLGFFCDNCKVSFTNKTSFILHQRKFHKAKEGDKNSADEINDNLVKDDVRTCADGALQCLECGSYLKSKKTLKKHMILKHNLHPQTSKTSRFRCMVCSFILCRAEDLRKHYSDVHKFHLEVDRHRFQTYEEFVLWKKEIEVESASLFVKYSGDKHHGEGKFVKQIFHCQRSGNFISHGVGQRRLKRNGSVKINGHCPARIYVTKWKDGMVEVNYTKTHIGHDFVVNLQSLEEHRVLEEAKTKLSKEIQTMILQCQAIDELEEIKKSLEPAKSAIAVMKRKRRRAELRSQFGSIPRHKKSSNAIE